MKNPRRRLVTLAILALMVILAVGIVAFSRSKPSLNLKNDNSLFSLLSSQSERSQEELVARLEKLTRKLTSDQDARLLLLEKQNAELLRQIRLLRTPPPSASIREKLAHLYPYDPSVRFPAYIWQTWKHGLNDERFDEKYREGETQWAMKNPGFVHELFNDDTSYAVVRHHFQAVPEIIEAYEALPEVILRMDFFRYLILFAKGGVYADIDTYPLQPIPNWIPENVGPDEIGIIAAIGLDSNLPRWREEAARRLEFSQAIIQCKPGHPVLREIISNIVQHTQEKKLSDTLKLEGSSNQKGLAISQWTGTGRWTDTILRYFNDYIQSSIYHEITWKEFHDLQVPKLVSDILVLPIKSFALTEEIPKDGKVDDPLAFAKHYQGKIWKTT